MKNSLEKGSVSVSPSGQQRYHFAEEFFVGVRCYRRLARGEDFAVYLVTLHTTGKICEIVKIDDKFMTACSEDVITEALEYESKKQEIKKR